MKYCIDCKSFKSHPLSKGRAPICLNDSCIDVEAIIQPKPMIATLARMNGGPCGKSAKLFEPKPARPTILDKIKKTLRINRC